ncbi:uncharacterized protein [Periplaneta americana]|uniref:uncharacterized protein n=1 Tax=Periplaneta americana TaxID=6978 RepID=UPI0037E73BFB
MKSSTVFPLLAVSAFLPAFYAADMMTTMQTTNAPNSQNMTMASDMPSHQMDNQAKGGAMMKKIGSKCMSMDDCKSLGANVECSKSMCKCKDGYKSTKDMMKCEMNAAGRPMATLAGLLLVLLTGATL